MSILFFTVNWFCGYRNRKTVKNPLQTVLYRTHTCRMRNAMLNTKRGSYARSPADVPPQVGEDNRELEPKYLIAHQSQISKCLLRLNLLTSFSLSQCF